jgi:hypothetical protein
MHLNSNMKMFKITISIELCLIHLSKLKFINIFVRHNSTNNVDIVGSNPQSCHFIYGKKKGIPKPTILIRPKLSEIKIGHFK